VRIKEKLILVLTLTNKLLKFPYPSPAKVTVLELKKAIEQQVTPISPVALSSAIP
jgi:hypothetical protein